MASGKKESEAFNMLKFMYQDDEDDDMEDAEKSDDEYVEEPESRGQKSQHRGEESENVDREEPDNEGTDSGSGDPGSTPRQQQPAAGSTPQNSLVSAPSVSLGEAMAVDSQRSRRERPAIVDYGHDEVAMSPEAEEGEISGNDHIISAELLKNTNGNVNISTPTSQEASHSNAQLDISQSNCMDNNSKDAKEELMAADVPKDADPLDTFLPPPPKAKCLEDLQEKINKFLALKRHGKSFNAEVRNRKDYRNPDFLLHAVRYQDIDQTGSCFSKDVFDPHGYDESDYYDAIEADMKREMERKEQERKKSPKVDFVSGGTQAAVAAATKISMSVPGLQPAPATVDLMARDSKHNKKSKWDKVEGERRNVIGGGQDSVSAVAAHAALISAASAGSGYAVFAQQKRREADERRSSERKLDRKS